MTTENLTLTMKKGATYSEVRNEYLRLKRDGRTIGSISMHCEDVMAIRSLNDIHNRALIDESPRSIKEITLFGIPIIQRID